ncbi:hypothetical protein DPMN_147949 [Dreissena polymorpha]|uniref:Uncharacterized protein n=1 Tax=Dreissena polymorpha TaxID=45954 RepID=A0A9D4FAS8_DREPO|nr:hypothetical protein DPMN_147949 [Dreissena polymorpha]
MLYLEKRSSTLLDEFVYIVRRTYRQPWGFHSATSTYFYTKFQGEEILSQSVAANEASRDSEGETLPEKEEELSDVVRLSGAGGDSDGETLP